MAPLEIIGAGYGRTGTESLRIALNMLGFHTHHMTEMFERDGHPEVFQEAYEHPDHEIDWDMLYEGFDAAVDWPTAEFLAPLLKKYPNAKVLLTERDFDSWYTSVANTLHPMAHNVMAPSESAYMRRIFSMVSVIAMGGDIVDPKRFSDKEAIRAKFEEHYNWVKRTVPEDRLLVLQLGEGWDRLCKFLGKPVPDVPYPRTNSTKEVNSRSQQVNARMEKTGMN
ncbi:P-loop containing nucleoside triphosphate hydrolase protein [Zychaea mexicana]|uniref:P-loop containing nucleoside triphosphate hydrolase protein n=1 Tax=Zychaea mexicana TaxID=64656 RepID=UPI0022FE946A|nr:P-loop containing nucleoside triphosphate hydrolase protein [Zychaea mexicana]KAI9496681.1 P-loop containing nucleoside triphosphate hydrolase protein [Zychaea mexicana]